ncbi:MAG: hypothetical protein M3Z36_04255, partial [Acidobacteriota bacterium]|nr:hypothetical protein [Acidobacteriota bacterium]
IVMLERIGRRLESGTSLQTTFAEPGAAENPRFGAQTSFRDLAFIFFKHKWSVLAIVLTSMFGLLFWMYFVREESYDVTAKILVKIGQEQTSSSSVSIAPILITGERSQDVNSEVDVLTSADLLDPLVAYFRLDRPSPPKPLPDMLLPRVRYEIRQEIKGLRDWWTEKAMGMGLRERLTPRERATAALRKMLHVAAERNSNILSVHLTTPQREDAGVILNKLLELYEAFRLKLYVGQDTAGFFRGEMDKSGGALSAAERDLRAFENAWDISAIETQKEVLLGQIAAAQAALKNVEIDFNENSAKLARAETEMKAPEPNFAAIGTFEPQSFLASLLQQMAELQKERAALRMTELDSGDRVRNNRDQFALLMNLAVTNLRSSVAHKRSQFEARKQILEDLETRIRGLQDKEAEWNGLKRKSKIFEDNYLNYGKRLEEASATSTMEKKHMGNVAIVEHATDPIEPIGMPKTRILGLCFVLSLFAALAWVAVAEFLDHRVYTREVVERHLSAPVFEVLPDLTRSRVRFGRRKLTWPENSFSRTASALVNAVGERGHCVFVSSANRGGGTTTATLGVAEQLSTMFGLRTLVVELDHRRPVLLNRFKLDPEKTIDAFVTGRLTPLECVQKNGASMSFLPALVAPAGNQVTPGALRKLLAGVQPNFDFVLVDSPPILDPGSSVIPTLPGKLLLVVEAGRTRYEMLDRVHRELSPENVDIAGAILNKQRRFIPSWAYRWFVQ